MLDTLKPVITIAETLYTQLKTLERCQAQATALAERLKSVTDLLKQLDDKSIKDNTSFETFVTRLNQWLADATDKTKHFNIKSSKQRLLNFVKAGGYLKRFEALDASLGSLISELNACLNIQQYRHLERAIEGIKTNTNFAEAHAKDVANIQAHLVSMEAKLEQRDEAIQAALAKLSKQLTSIQLKLKKESAREPVTSVFGGRKIVAPLAAIATEAETEAEVEGQLTSEHIDKILDSSLQLASSETGAHFLPGASVATAKKAKAKARFTLVDKQAKPSQAHNDMSDVTTAESRGGPSSPK